MPVKEKNTAPNDSSTQRYLPFSQIRENIIIMKDDSARIVLECSTINFLLKSEEEQNSIIYSFQRFLNSLDFPIQILVRSKKLDIEWYLSKLSQLAIKQQNSLLQNQTYEYIEYLKKLVEVAQIMKKEFYIIIPYDTDEWKSVRDNWFIWVFKNFWAAINSANDIIKIKAQIRNFGNLRKWVAWRVGVIKTSLENIWVKARELEKDELIKFLTDYYNPSIENFTAFKWTTTNYNLIQN